MSEPRMSDPGSLSLAAALLVRRWAHGLTRTHRRARLDRDLQTSLQEVGRRSLDVAFNEATIAALQQKAREAFVLARERREAIFAMEGAPVSEDLEERRRQEEERGARARELRLGLDALLAESDRCLALLGSEVIARQSADPRVVPYLERHAMLLSEAASLERRVRSDLAAWQQLPTVTKLGGLAAVLSAPAMVLALAWLIFSTARGDPAPPRRTLTLAIGRTAPSPVVTSPVTTSVAGVLSSTGPVAIATGTSSRPAQVDRRTRPDAGQGVLEPPSTFTGFVKTTGAKVLHRFSVAPELPAAVLDPKAHHLGGADRPGWERPHPEGRTLELALRLDRAPVGISELVFEASAVEPAPGTQVRVNGGHTVPLFSQRDTAFVEFRLPLPPAWLLEGKNEIVFESGGPPQSLENFQIRNVRWVAGPVLYRFSLSKVPGVDTRLAVLAAVGDKPGKTILTLHEAVVGEQVYPNLPLAAGDYYLEVSGDGRNLDVPYVAEVQRLAPLGPGDEREPDDDAAGATPLEIDRPVTGYLATAGDADFFSLKVTQDTYLAIVLGAIPGVDPSVRIKDSRGNSQIVDVNTGGVGEPDEAELVKLPAGEYRLVVQARAESPKANARAPYRLEVRRAAAQAGFEEEPDNAPDQANRLPLGGSLRGRLDPADDQDWYSFHLDRPSLVRIGVTGMDGVAYQVWLENPGYPLPLGRTGADASVTNWPLDKGDHCFGLAARTTRAVDRRQSYRVRVEVVAEPDNGYSVRNNSFETATDITPDDTLRSALYPWEDADFYRVTFKERDLVYRLRPIQLSLNRLGVQIHDERRTLLKIVAGSTLENWTPAPGRYTLRVYRLDGGNHQEDYSFRIQEERLSTPEEEREFNDSRQTATGLAEETLMHGQLSPMGAGLRDEDWYRIDPKDGAGKLYAIEAAPGGKQLDLAMALEDADGKPVLPARNQRGAGEPERLENWGPKPGSYFLHVWCPVDQNRNAPYTVRWRETGRRSADMEFEPNDAVDQANDLKLDVVVQGRLTTPEDGDVFRVTGTRPDAQIVRVKLTGADNLHRVTILDSTGAVISSEAMPHGGSMEFTGFVLSRGQSLFVKVGCNSYQYRAASADYSVVATEVGPWKEGLEAEPNFDLARAGKLSVDRDMVGQMWPEGDQDLFVWEVPEKDPGPYTLSISPPDQNLCIDLAHSKDGKEWAPLASVRGKLALPNIRARAGRYRVTLSSHGFSATPYTIRVSRQPGPDPGRDLEFNNSPDWAVPLDTGTPLRGLTAYDGDVDCLLARGSGPTPLRLKIKVDDKSGLEAIVSRREGKELREVKRLGLDRGEEATVERWVTGDRDSVIAVKGYWSEQPTYEVSLLPSTASVTADAEPNDQFADALTLVPGREIAGSIDHRCDRDVYRLDVTSPDGQPFTLAYAGPTRCETRVSLRTWDEQNKREVDTHTVTVQAGKTLKLDDLLLTRGTWYVAIDGAVAKAAYQLRIDAAKAPSSDRIYAPSHHGANPREALLDRPLHGQFLPFGHERWEGVRLTLDRPRSLGVHLAVPKACDGWLVLFDAQGRELRSWSLEPEGRDESAYLPTLEAGSYVIEVRGRAREETGYALTVKTGAPGYFFPEKSRSPELNVAFRDNGGHIVRATSTYGSDWAPESLLDGSVESRGWCSKDSTLPQEVVIGFAGDRIARIGSIRVNPRTADPPEHWAKTVELLVLATGKGDDWQSVGTLTLHREDRDVVVDFPPREAKQVMVRVKASNGGQYTQLGEVSVMEAVPGFQSCLRGDHAIPLGSSDFAGGMNVLSSVLGGKIESVSAEYDGTWNAGRLLDGWPADPGWLTPDAASPAEVVASIGGAPVEIDRVILSGRGHDWRDVAKDVKLWVAESKERGFREVASFRMQPWSLWQTLAFRPVKARFVKLRILSGYGGGYFYLGELGAIGR